MVFVLISSVILTQKIYSMKLSSNKILITGGGTGIGFGLAERFVQEDNQVIICGRRESALNEAKVKLPSLVSKVCDLSTEIGRLELFQWIEKNHPDVNVLVNNAGIQNWMPVADENFYEKAKQEISINIEAPLHLITLFLRLKSLDTIINVSSGLSFAPLAKVPVYCASKAFLHSFTLSLRHLLKSKNIEVIELIPPALNTDLGGKGIHDSFPPVSGFIESAFQQLKEGKVEITYGLSERASQASGEDVKKNFERMNA
jgi:uncharacterized oxidoreductase